MHSGPPNQNFGGAMAPVAPAAAPPPMKTSFRRRQWQAATELLNLLLLNTFTTIFLYSCINEKCST